MLGSLIKKIFGDKNLKDQKEFEPYVLAALEFGKTLLNQSDDELRSHTPRLKGVISAGLSELENESATLRKRAIETNDVLEKEDLFEKIDGLDSKIDAKLEEILLTILPEAFAVVKETSRRWAENGKLEVTATENDIQISKTKDGVTIEGDKAIWSNHWTAAGQEVVWNMIHYDVQFMGGAVLHTGKIAEMQTGEGKTLVATLPVYLNALSGKGVHMVTVNDYLAKRDSEWMGPLYQFHGLKVACIDRTQPNSPERREAYKADITFGTNNEFGFDYLRDNMAGDVNDLVQGKHHFAIVDEVDSVLIDDARTPLIISGPTSKGDQHEFMELKPVIEALFEAQKKVVNTFLNEAKKALTVISEQGGDAKELKASLEAGGIALLRSHRGLPKSRSHIKFLSEPGIKTHLLKTENVYMAEQNKRMPEIDSELFFVIDEKQNTIDLTKKGLELVAKFRDAEFFILPDLGTEITKLTAEGHEPNVFLEKKEELIRAYSIKSDRIHSINQLMKAYALFEKEVEYVIMDGKVKIVDEQTGRIMEGRRYSDGLHQAIEAKENVTIEASTQTYATITLQNYFRMYHKLCGMTGTAETEAKEFWDIYKLDVVVVPTHRAISRTDQNDLVYRSIRDKFNAVIIEVEELVAKGRPVLVGTTTVEISEILSRMLKMKGIKHEVLNAKHHQREAEIVQNAGKSGAVTIATNMAGRGTDIKLGEGVKELGGLAIIGTERHESRRVDRQLRGRSGRQGDPGSSKFFVSLEDDLMRRFGSDRTAAIMDRIGMKEGEVISHRLISRSIEVSQKKVEENNFGSRKHLLEYDDVMSAQRKAIYRKRKNALLGERLSIDIANAFYEVSASMVNSGLEFEEYEMEMLRILGIQSPVDAAQFKSMQKNKLIDLIFDASMEHYNRKNTRMIDKVLPQIVNAVNMPNSPYENMALPLSNGRLHMDLTVPMKEAINTKGSSMITSIERQVVLNTIDSEWKEHLREMDELKTSVRQATYEQKDPLLVYKLESYELFKNLAQRINDNSMEFLIKVDLEQDIEEVKTTNKQISQANNYGNASSTQKQSQNNGGGYDSNGYSTDVETVQEKVVRKPIIAEPKVGRNDACPCGSGKKYKACHGA